MTIINSKEKKSQQLFFDIEGDTIEKVQLSVEKCLAKFEDKIDSEIETALMASEIGNWLE